MNRIKVLHVAPLNPRGEIPVFLRNQIDSLDSELIDSSVIGFRGSSLSLLKPIQFSNRVKQLKQELKSDSFDIIHAHWGSLLGLLVGIFKPLNAPLVLTLRGSDVNKSFSDKLTIYLLRLVLTTIATKLSNHTIYVSENLIRPFHAAKMRYSVIPDGTPLDIFYPIDQSQARTTLGWKVSNVYIAFYCGGRPEDKNLPLAREVIDKLRSKYNCLDFVVIESNLKQKELAMLFSACDLLLFTSHSEGSPNVVREALACSCPVVTVDVGDVKKWIVQGQNGFVCPAELRSLAKGAQIILDNKIRPDSKMAIQYSTSTVASKIEKVYSSLVVSN